MDLSQQVNDLGSVPAWKVESATTPGGFYTVFLLRNVFECTCPGFAYKQTCKHVDLVKTRFEEVDRRP